MVPILQAEDLGRFARGQWLLRNVAISIQPGARLGITGASGSGKTVLLRALSLLNPITEGTICYHGSEIQSADIPKFRSRVIYLHQRPVFTGVTVEDALRQPFSLASHRHHSFPKQEVLAYLNALGRHDSFLQKPQHELSGGEAQLTAFLRAIQLQPEILLLDEPTAVLDEQATSQLEFVIAEWLRESTTHRATLWVSHDQSQLARVAESVRKMNRGILEPAQ